MSDLKVTAASAIQRDMRLVELPQKQNGVAIVVRLGGVPMESLVAALEGLPGMSQPDDRKVTWEDGLTALKGAIPVARRVAELAVMEPAFYFGDEAQAGAACWGALSYANQMAVLATAMEMAGLTGATAAGKGAAAGATFPS